MSVATPSAPRFRGPTFISYKRQRAADVALIAAALKDRGVPVWRDIDDLPHKPAEAELRRVLAAADTDGAVLYVTPEIRGSAMVRKVEAPAIVARAAGDPDFDTLVVVAGGLKHATFMEVFAGAPLGGHDLGTWNVCQVDSDPLTPEDAARIAAHVLKARLRKLGRDLGPDEPLSIQIYDQRPRAHTPPHGLTIDWSHRFASERQLADGAADRFIRPALAELAAAIEATPGLSDRPLHLTGNLYLPLAVAVGAEFRAVRRFRVSWRQHRDGATQDWGRHIPATPSGITSRIVERDPDAQDMAVLVSIAADVMTEVCSVLPALPPLRAILHLGRFHSPTGPAERITLDPGQARDAADRVIEAIRQLRTTHGATGTVHLFLAVPAGVALMIGQGLNTIPRAVLYQRDPEQHPIYKPMVTLTPSN